MNSLKTEYERLEKELDFFASPFDAFMQTLNPFNMEKEKTQKTIRELLDEFQQKYTIDDLTKSEELNVLHQYLSKQAARNNGDFYHEPSEYISELIFVHLGYDCTFEK